MRASALVLGVMFLAALPAGAKSVPCRQQKPTTWDITIVAPNEPGKRMVLAGRVIDTDSRRPVPGIAMYAYHADASSRYNTANNEGLEPRLCGVLRTNERGEYRIHTVLPSGMSGAPHVHVELWGANLPRVARVVNLRLMPEMKDDKRYLTVPKSLHEYRPREDATQNFRPAYPDKDGVYYVTWDIAIEALNLRKVPVLPGTLAR
jgi:hypothetical protein